MTLNELTLTDPARLREYFLHLVELNDDATRRPQGTVQIELFLPHELAEKVDDVIGRRGRSILSREHILLSALLWSLANFEEADLTTQLGLDVDSTLHK